MPHLNKTGERGVSACRVFPILIKIYFLNKTLFIQKTPWYIMYVVFWRSDPMHLFRKNHHKLPPLFKCVVCQHKPGDSMHHHIPICSSCKVALDKHIEHDGGSIIQCLNALRKARFPLEITQLSDSIINHASKLVPYEDLRLKTIEPAPTVIMHRVRMKDYNDLFPELFSDSRE